MNSQLKPRFLFGHFLVVFAVFAICQVALADPMTGGNAPYEDCSPPCATSCYVLPPRFGWYAEADAIGMRRDPYGSSPFAALDTNFDTVLSTADLDHDFKAGARLKAGHTFDGSNFSIEGSYFELDDWDNTGEVRDLTGGNLYSPFSNFGNPALVGFDNNRLISIREQSWLKNGELNVKYLIPMPNTGFRASFITGVRYISVSETLEYQSFLQTNPTQTPSQRLKTWTNNDLIGPQIGGHFEFFSIYNSWISFEVKGAICGNSAKQNTWDANTNANVVSDHVATAFVGDLELMFNWQIASHCIARFGYQAMWVDGLALAARNLGPAGTAMEVGPVNSFGIDTIGNVVYHGPHIGLEIGW